MQAHSLLADFIYVLWPLFCLTRTLFIEANPFFTAGTWYAPTVTGDVPPPCFGFSLLNIDEFHAVLFGGSMEGQGYSSDVYYLDLRIWVSDSGGHDGF